jgi:hypothetical protein
MAVGGNEMATFLEVRLTIGVAIDAEYSSSAHADDIVQNVRRLFPAADIVVDEMRTCTRDERRRSVRLHLAADCPPNECFDRYDRL